MLYSKKVVLSLGIAASLSGVAQADLLGGSVGGGLVSQVETRTVGAFGDHAGIAAHGRAVADAAGEVSTTGVEEISAETGAAATGTMHGVVYTGQEVSAQAETQSRAALRRANRAARRAAAEGAVAANGAYASSTSAASNVGAVASGVSNAASGITADGSRVGANGATSGDVVAGSGEGRLDGAVRGDAGANADVDPGRGNVEGSFESSVAGSASAN